MTGKGGEVVKLPSGGLVKAPLVVLVGLGEDPDGAACGEPLVPLPAP